MSTYVVTIPEGTFTLITLGLVLGVCAALWVAFRMGKDVAERDQFISQLPRGVRIGDREYPPGTEIVVDGWPQYEDNGNVQIRTCGDGNWSVWIPQHEAQSALRDLDKGQPLVYDFYVPEAHPEVGREYRGTHPR